MAGTFYVMYTIFRRGCWPAAPASESRHAQALGVRQRNCGTLVARMRWHVSVIVRQPLGSLVRLRARRHQRVYRSRLATAHCGQFAQARSHGLLVVAVAFRWRPFAFAWRSAARICSVAALISASDTVAALTTSMTAPTSSSVALVLDASPSPASAPSTPDPELPDLPVSLQPASAREEAATIKLDLM